MLSVLAPRYWGAHVVMVVLLTAAVLLGVWQLGVWENHRTSASADRTHTTPVPLARALGTDEAFPADAVGRPVDLAGTWLGQDDFLVGGRDQDGDQGYWMVVPLAVDGTRSAIPVVLGWLADPADRPSVPQGHAELTAWLQPSMSDADAGTDASNTSSLDSGTEVLATLQTSEVTQLVDQDLYDGYAVARAGQSGLVRADLPTLPDAGWATSLRNLLYAMQWWVFGGFAVLMWWRWIAEDLEARRHPASTVAT